MIPDHHPLLNLDSNPTILWPTEHTEYTEEISIFRVFRGQIAPYLWWWHARARRSTLSVFPRPVYFAAFEPNKIQIGPGTLITLPR